MVGIYPVGSLVRLKSQRLAVVIAQSEGSLLKPVVKVFFSTRTQLPLPQHLVGANVLGEVIRRKQSSGDAVATVISFLCKALGIEEEQVEAIVNSIQMPPRTFCDPATIRVGNDHVIIPPPKPIHLGRGGGKPHATWTKIVEKTLCKKGSQGGLQDLR